MGNKKKLVQKGLVDLFPKDIHNYYEPFAGSAVVAMNVKADKYLINDIDSHIYKLYLMFRHLLSEDIITHIEQRIEEFGLPKERTKRNVYQDKSKIEEYKNSYLKFRTQFNQRERGLLDSFKTTTVLDFYTLMLFSFSQQFRFNSKGEYNMPFGNDCFTDKNKEYIVNGCNFFSNRSQVRIHCLSFARFYCRYAVEMIGDKNSFVYLDPPYFNTTAVYNEKKGANHTWSEENELELRMLCDGLTKYGVKFAMSNVFANKDFINTSLQKWCEKNNYRVHHFNHSYTACGRGNANTDEVLIMNY